MKRFSEQLNKKAKSIRLKAAEKRDLRDRLVSYMEYHPLPSNMKQKVDETISLEQSVKTIHVSGLRFLQWSGVMVAIFTLVVPYAAERAVPGDTLYAVKVHLNEEVRSTLARSSYEKIVWETELLNRRIAEARLLANEGRLTEETETMVADAVRTHSDNAKKEIENLKQTDKDEAVLASIQLDTALDVQTTSLRNSDHASTTEGMSVTKIATVLEESQSDESSDIAVEDLPSYERLMGQVEIESTRAHELLSSIKDLATAEEQDDIKRRLEDIGRKTDSAMKVLEESDVDAGTQLVNVLQQTQKLIVFMTNIDVRGSVTVDEIVPVTLTSEERLEVIKGQMDETIVLLERIDLVVSTSTSANILEKVEFANKKSKLLLEEANSMLAEESIDMDKVEIVVLEAFDLAKDAWGILEASGIEVVVKEIVEEEEVSTSTHEVIEEEENTTATSTETMSTTTEEVVISDVDTLVVSTSTSSEDIDTEDATDDVVEENPEVESEVSLESQV